MFKWPLSKSLTYRRLNVAVGNVAGVHVADAADHLRKVELGVALVHGAALLQQLAEAARIRQLHEDVQLLIDEEVHVQADGEGIVHHLHDEELVLHLDHRVLTLARLEVARLEDHRKAALADLVQHLVVVEADHLLGGLEVHRRHHVDGGHLVGLQAGRAEDAVRGQRRLASLQHKLVRRRVLVARAGHRGLLGGAIRIRLGGDRRPGSVLRLCVRVVAVVFVGVLVRVVVMLIARRFGRLALLWAFLLRAGALGRLGAAGAAFVVGDFGAGFVAATRPWLSFAGLGHGLLHFDAGKVQVAAKVETSSQPRSSPFRSTGHSGRLNRDQSKGGRLEEGNQRVDGAKGARGDVRKEHQVEHKVDDPHAKKDGIAEQVAPEGVVLAGEAEDAVHLVEANLKAVDVKLAKSEDGAEEAEVGDGGVEDRGEVDHEEEVEKLPEGGGGEVGGIGVVAGEGHRGEGDAHADGVEEDDEVDEAEGSLCLPLQSGSRFEMGKSKVGGNVGTVPVVDKVQLRSLLLLLRPFQQQQQLEPAKMLSPVEAGRKGHGEG
ncbi:hypothetical protein TYRP_011233 [Tyrophagus putrescentiae]|nr:hypothetical protein TYRP_011233 [Tyrophagus putrescentiae]